MKPIVPAKVKVFRAGDRVVLTQSALRYMGIKRKDELARVWTVRECHCGLCLLGRHVCTDQACQDGIGWRHIAIKSLRLEGHPALDSVPPGPLEVVH